MSDASAVGASSGAAKSWLITGCSSGFGHSLAEAALERGDRVLLTARSVDTVAGLAARYPRTAHVHRLDVTHAGDIASVVHAAMEIFGGVDVLVNNAGYSIIGAVEEVSALEYRALYETNLFGPIEIMRAFIPHMRTRRSGVIVNLSSIGGAVPTPGMGHYSATKSALESISEALHGELAPYGVRVLIVEPGLFRTRVSQAVQYAAGLSETYSGSSGVWRDRMAHLGGKEPGDPAMAAAAILRAVDDPQAPLRLPLGAMAPAVIGQHLRGLIEQIEASAEVAAACDFPQVAMNV
jgi:NAD(P)-dependent dehydrogenase (short-subunit alcohol dehydrogenase family)